MKRHIVTMDVQAYQNFDLEHGDEVLRCHPSFQGERGPTIYTLTILGAGEYDPHEGQAHD